MNTPNTSDRMVVGSRVAAATSTDVEEIDDASIVRDGGTEWKLFSDDTSH